MPTAAKKRSRPRKRPIVLKLYVTGANRRSQRAIRNLKQICDEHVSGECDLEVVDLYQFPDSARAADVLAAPTLIKELPLPARRLVGDLSQSDRVMLILDLKKEVIPMPVQVQVSQIEVEQLQRRLAELEQTWEAIRSGEADALVVEGADGPKVYTLQTLDQPYRELVEQMSEGAASFSETGTVLFCNERLAEMVGRSPEKIIGSPVGALITGPGRAAFKDLLDRSLESEARDEVQLERSDGKPVPVQASLRGVMTERGRTIFMVATDLSELREAEQAIRVHDYRHDALVSTTSDGYLPCNAEGKILDVNET